MNDEVTAIKMANMETDISDIKKTLTGMPDIISKKLEDTMDLKISNAVQQVKLDFYKWLVPLILGLLGTMAATIFSFIR